MFQWWPSLEPTIMQYVFIICFTVGLVLFLLDILLGCFSDVLSLDFGLDVAGGTSLLPLRPMCVLTAITIFGGVGTLLSLVFAVDLSGWLIALIAALAGIAAAFLVDRLVLTPLKNNRADAFTAQQLIGQTAEVTVRIRPGTTGEVSIKNERGILNYSAQWYDRQESATVEAGTIVGIMDVAADSGLIYVVPLDMEKWIKHIKG